MGKAQRTFTKTDCGIILVILLASIATRFSALFQTIRYDEALSYYYFTGESLVQITHSYIIPNNHIFHNILCSFILTFFELELWSLRLVAFSAGVLCGPLAYYIGLQYFKRDIAFYFALLVACNSYLVEFSTNARGYSLICLFALIYLLLFHSFLKRRIAAGIIFIGTTILGAYTIPVMLYPTGGFLLAVAYFWFFEEKGKALKPKLTYLSIILVSCGLGTLILYYPILNIQGLSALTQNPWVTANPTYSSFLSEMAINTGDFFKFTFRTEYVVTAGILILGFAWGSLKVKAAHRTLFIFIIANILFLLSFSLLRKVYPFPRVMIYMLPLLLLLTSIGLGELTKRLKPFQRTAFNLIFVVLLLADTIFSDKIEQSNETGKLQNIDKVLSFIEGQGDADAIIATAPSDFPLLFYTRNNKSLNSQIYSTDFGYAASPKQSPSELPANGIAYVVEDKTYDQDIAKILKRFGLRFDPRTATKHPLNEAINIWKIEIEANEPATL